MSLSGHFFEVLLEGEEVALDAVFSLVQVGYGLLDGIQVVHHLEPPHLFAFLLFLINNNSSLRVVVQAIVETWSVL